MALAIELFGDDAFDMEPEEFKDEVKALTFTWPERRSYLMHEYQAETGHQWSAQDYDYVDGVQQ